MRFQVIHAPVTRRVALGDVCHHFGRTAAIALDEALDCAGIEVLTSVKPSLIESLMKGSINAKDGIAFAAREVPEEPDRDLNTFKEGS